MATVALVHERITEFAGSEAVVDQLARIWPDAPIYAPVARTGVMPTDVQQRVRSTKLSRLLRGGTYAHLLPVLPIAMRHLNLSSYDLIVASHHAFANQVVHATGAPVISYVHSPARWVYDAAFRRGEVGGPTGRALLAGFSELYKPSDRRAARKVYKFVANSTAVAQRISDWWGRESEVVHPPVDTDWYTHDASAQRGDFFLMAGRLVSYKRPDLAVRAATAAGVRLVVAGSGRARSEVERFAGPNVEFLGRVSDANLRQLYRTCAALLLPGVEDFGIIPVEAQSCGAPVIAVDEGGSRDSVLAGLTGSLIPQGSRRDEVQIWAEALRDFDPGSFRTETIVHHASGFSRASFAKKMIEIVSRA